MAEESDLERSEPASQRRLDQARERGQVPRSPELSTFSVLLAAGGGLMVLGSGLVQSLESVLRAALTLDRNAGFETGQMGARLCRVRQRSVDTRNLKAATRSGDNRRRQDYES